uniref:4-coumarate--CoA ligase-like 9 n=1 Tax=Nicotiana tabacum TaxID=4097 RepID=A0A1S4D1J9_TOBAC|nr:4-coumarate--CoA ligase-like 9 [Nicotiana tomentosiformis]XP_016507266.1 PREDICTED: 4-coumarate--CoA ligase-like 9 [Nicotiana tabacum]
MEHYSIDPKNGYSTHTKTFHSLRSSLPLPPLSQPISIIQYTLSLLNSTTTATTTFLIDSTTGRSLSYSEFLHKTQSLASSLKIQFPSLSKNDVAFILSPPSLHVPVLYFALLSLGIVVSPANPLSSSTELTHMIQLSKPTIAFTTSSNSHKLIPSFPLRTILIDSPKFLSMLEHPIATPMSNFNSIVHQTDSAAILYSSGTTGRVKGVELTHRNLIALTAGLYNNKFSSDESENAEQDVAILTLPLFHVFGFFILIRLAAMGETAVIMERFDFEKMLAAVEKYKVTYMPVSPPLVVAMAKSELVLKYDLTSLKLVACGGAPLGKEVAERFKARFSNVEIVQVCV